MRRLDDLFRAPNGWTLYGHPLDQQPPAGPAEPFPRLNFDGIPVADEFVALQREIERRYREEILKGPLLAAPEGFVRLSESAGAHLGPVQFVEEVHWERNSVTFMLSREAALDFGLAEPTPEEAAQRAEQAAEFARAWQARWAEPAAEVTVENLTARLGWSVDFAQHLVHSACCCDPLRDDPSYCPEALRLGYDENQGDQ